MKLINIRVIVDPAGALEDNRLSGHLHMIDNNRLAGSQNQSTDHLSTAVSPGDRIVWSLQSIECEAYVALHSVNLPTDICDVQKNTYPGTNVSYWTATVKQAVGDLPYGLVFEIGSRSRLISNNDASRLIDAIPSVVEVPGLV
ncbi:hypothetical protein RMR16_018615 [Agrobacterium sp. rho-13.3]|uniref:hypothetical protein n=1 Tax=Agrobacterium sp. rho-13.3 TaxID=3072980 RepID=UPI002A12BDE2|nr:hypothetical protein [Agrobacterium sp. rho-13.3]MDX8308328.1 hypothetical protein [Agrobacterium sp. rho-13.3]